eukprot:5948-Pyramimonas_sp.AAC.1
MRRRSTAKSYISPVTSGERVERRAGRRTCWEAQAMAKPEPPTRAAMEESGRCVTSPTASTPITAITMLAN